MKEIWIIGAGRFGRMAADRLTGKIKNLRLVLVDLAAEKLHEAEGPGRTLIKADGAAYLAEHLSKGKEHHPDWIVPAVPIHLAAEWCLLNQSKKNLQRINFRLTSAPNTRLKQGRNVYGGFNFIEADR